MKIVVYPHDLSIGGSQLNAIEIAAEVQRLGHTCVIFGRSGPLVNRITELGLEFVESPPPGQRPSPVVMRSLAQLVRERSIDIIHGYEWPPALEAWLISLASRGSVACVSTVMSMSIAPFLPRSMPLIVGTHQIDSVERASGRRLVTVIEPPVDLVMNAPTSEARRSRALWGIGENEICIVAVTRLAHEMKLEGILTAINSIPKLRARSPARMLIVGDGPARDEVRMRAEQVNSSVGEPVVVLAGSMDDPRPAYDAADIMIGMGGSALKSLAFARPLLVQGERGFWRLLTPQTVDEFLWAGWYGVGPGQEHGEDAFLKEIRPVMDDSNLRVTLGNFGRNLLEARFGLEEAAERQLSVYKAACAIYPNTASRLGDIAQSTSRYARYVLARETANLFGRANNDDFNSKPVVLSGPPAPPARD